MCAVVCFVLKLFTASRSIDKHFIKNLFIQTPGLTKVMKIMPNRIFVIYNNTLHLYYCLHFISCLLCCGCRVSVIPHRNFIVASIFVKHALESEYPKLLRLFNDLWEQLRLNTPISIQSMSGLEPTELPRDIVVTRCLHESDAAPFKDVLSPFESAYIAKSLSRLLDAVNVVFPANARNPPSKHEMIGIVKTVTR